MSKFGIHALCRVTDWTDESIRYAVDKTAEVGYDLIEAVISRPRRGTSGGNAQRALAQAKLGCVRRAWP